MYLRFQDKVLKIYPDIEKSDIRIFWENFYYSSIFSGQKRISKNSINYQSYVTTNKPLSEFQVRV